VAKAIRNSQIGFRGETFVFMGRGNSTEIPEKFLAEIARFDPERSGISLL
jgi:hypothetical protein